MADPDDTTAKDRRTVFVQGISYDVKDKEFEEAFSEVGPIRKCFLLRNRGQERHRGLGYVQFALPEDAARAVSEYSGKILLGRQVQVTAATKRAPLAERKQRKREEAELKEHEEAQQLEPPAKKAKLSQPALLGDKLRALRTIALGGFQPDKIEQAIAMAHAAGEVEEVAQDVPEEVQTAAKLRQDGCSGCVILVIFKSVRAAFEAVPKLHRQQLPAKRKKASESTTLWARQLKGEGAMVKKWRLILRNLPFKVAAEELRSFLAAAGFVWEITIPQKEDGSSKGFAFASFTSKALAEKGIKLTNGKKLRGRVVAVDWAVSKAAFETSMLDADATTGPADGAVDSAAPNSKGPFRDTEDGPGEVQVNPGTERDLMRSLANQIAGADEAEAQNGERAAGGGQQTAEVAERKVRADKAEAGPSSQADAGASVQRGGAAIGRTVFVRGIGAEVTKQHLQARLESFGTIRACRLVMNPVTKQPKGTAFVEFGNAVDAKKAVDASARGRSGAGPGVSVGGVLLEIDVAVTQDDARAMASARAGNAGTKDKRNLYLAKEGLIEEGSAVWQDMSKNDQDKRLRANREKSTKMRSPNFFISTTRLSIRNLPFTMDEKGLKALLASMVKKRATKAVPHLKQVKILRDPERKGKDGKPQAKGIAFAEFSEHEHALCALRELNNNPVPFGKDRRPIVEFAVENAQTVKKREQRLATWKGKMKTDRQVAKVTEKHAEDRESQPIRAIESKKGQKHKQRDREKGINEALPNGLVGDQASVPPKVKRKKADQEQPGISDGGANSSRISLAKQKTKQDSAPRAQTEAPRNKDQAKKQKSVANIEERKQRKQKAEQTDGLDSLISKYRESLFGSEKRGTQKGSLKRWFE